MNFSENKYPYFTDSACQYWSTVPQVSPPFTCLTIITIFAPLSPPPQKSKIVADLRFDTFLVSLSTLQLLSKLYLVCFEYSWAENLVLLYICIYIDTLYCTCFVM